MPWWTQWLLRWLFANCSASPALFCVNLRRPLLLFLFAHFALIRGHLSSSFAPSAPLAANSRFFSVPSLSPWWKLLRRRTPNRHENLYLSRRLFRHQSPVYQQRLLSEYRKKHNSKNPRLSV